MQFTDRTIFFQLQKIIHRKYKFPMIFCGKHMDIHHLVLTILVQTFQNCQTQYTDFTIIGSGEDYSMIVNAHSV